MTKDIWINLPSKDVKRARAFFTSIGFKQNPQYPETEHSSCLFVGSKQVVVMLFAEAVFKGLVQNELNSTLSTEVLFSFDAESREEIDDLAGKVAAAGGSVFAKPGENQGWMYGMAFTDLDGHRWNALYMDKSKMPQANEI